MREWRPIIAFLATMLLAAYGLGVYTNAAAPSSKPPDRPTTQLTAQPTVLPPGPSSTPLTCTQNPSDLSVRAVLGPKTEKLSRFFQNVRVEGIGFTPSEKLYIVMEGHGINHADRIEVLDKQVSPDGTFAYDEQLQLDESNMLWQVFVKHRRGLACANFRTDQ